MCIKITNKTNKDLIKPYTYLLKFNVNSKIIYYYGVRCGNVRLKLSSENDIFKRYFTSSKGVKNLIENKILPYEIIIHKIFETNKDACEYEVKFLKRLHVKNRKDFLNQVEHFDNSLPNNLGRMVSAERRKKMSEISSKTQSDSEYRKNRSLKMKEKWASEEYREYMKNIYNKFKNSDEGKKFYENRTPSMLGKKQSEEALKKMRKPRGKYKNLKYYICPYCSNKFLPQIIKKHLIYKHNINLEESISIIATLKKV